MRLDQAKISLARQDVRPPSGSRKQTSQYIQNTTRCSTINQVQYNALGLIKPAVPYHQYVQSVQQLHHKWLLLLLAVLSHLGPFVFHAVYLQNNNNNNQSILSSLVPLGHTEEKITGEHSHLQIANASHADHAEKNIYII